MATARKSLSRVFRQAKHRPGNGKILSTSTMASAARTCARTISGDIDNPAFRIEVNLACIQLGLLPPLPLTTTARVYSSVPSEKV